VRKTLAVVTLTAALTGVPATAALADTAPVVVAQETTENADESQSDKTGLWGLLGLLGLAGLAKRKADNDVDVHPRR
jgi:MYXO-CTERM domain-containing protein